LEGAAQIRAFIVPNVALSASAGLGLVLTKDNNSATIGGQLGGTFGVTYFFF
jgi:Tfp pilus assembly protein PilZ